MRQGITQHSILIVNSLRTIMQTNKQIEKKTRPVRYINEREEKASQAEKNARHRQEERNSERARKYCFN